MHFCKAVIAPAEDMRNTVHRTEYSPISWPEVEIIRAIHGDASVVEIVPFVSVPQTPRAERQRLAEIYGDSACAHVWGGRSGPSEMEAPAATLKAGVTWINPLTFETEITGGATAQPPEETENVPFDDVKVAAKRK